MLIKTQNTAPKSQAVSNLTLAKNDIPPQRNAGLIAGTLVETAVGWRRVEMLRVGDHVQTYDGGLRQLRQIERGYYGVAGGAYPLDRTLHVPSGALDNCDDVMLMPEQMVLIESRLVEELLGELSVLIPAAALDGFRGISQQAPRGLIEAVSLRFDDEEVVYANSGLLAYCGDRGVPEGSNFFTTLDYGRAKALVSLLDQNRNVLDLAISTLNVREPGMLATAA